MHANVVIVGSLNMDLVTRVQRMPRPGETLAGESFATVPGGKGANQAVAAARLGAQVAMIGCVGSDAYGVQLRQALIAEGVDCQALEVLEDACSGVASIWVDAQGQNAIAIVAGANGRLTPASLARFDELLQQAQVIICQLEVPMDTVGYALKRGRELGKTVILNPAPASGPLPADWWAAIDYLIPNESEARALCGVSVKDPGSAIEAAGQLLALGVGKVIVTLGEQGVVFAEGQQRQHRPAPRVQALDSTAAGDTFVGGFAAALAQGRSECDAIRFGQQAAALSVTRAGAQPSIPDLLEVQGFATP